MSDEVSAGLDLSVLRKRFRTTSGATVAERKEKERRALAPTDGRRLRVGTRTVQVNLRVTPEFKEKLFELARDRGQTMTEVIESALDLLRKDEEGKSAKE